MSKTNMAATDADAASARHHAEGDPQGHQPTPRMGLKGSDLHIPEYYGPFKPDKEWTAPVVTRDEIFPDGRDFY